MALTIKNEKVIEKHLTANEEEIRKVWVNRDKEHHKKVLKKALKVKVEKIIFNDDLWSF